MPSAVNFKDEIENRRTTLARSVKPDSSHRGIRRDRRRDASSNSHIYVEKRARSSRTKSHSNSGKSPDDIGIARGSAGGSAEPRFANAATARRRIAHGDRR
jgi:hypothetical protein